MADKLFNKMFSIAAPVCHFIISLGIIFMAQYIRLAVLKSIYVRLIAFLFLIPLILFEVYFTKYFEGRGELRRRNVTGLFLRILLWVFVFYVFVEKPALTKESSDEVFFRILLSLPVLLYPVKYVLIANPVLSAAFIALNLIFYLLFTVRMRKARLVSLMILPGIFFSILSNIHYHALFFRISDEEIVRQEGVSIFFSPKTAKKKSAREIWKYPRMLWVDEKNNKLYASFGSTFGAATHWSSDSFWQIDMNTKAYRTIPAGPLFVFTKEAGDNYMYAAPKTNNILLVISKNTFTVKERLHYGQRDLPFAPQGIIKSGKDIYVAGEISNLIFKYNIVDKRVENILDFKKFGLAKLGEMGSNSLLKTEGYLITEIGVNGSIAFIDPEKLSLRKVIKLPDYQSGRLSNIGNNGLLFNTSFTNGNIYEINAKNFTSKKLYKLPISWCVFYDDKNDLLYSLDYFHGKLLLVDRQSGQIQHVFLVGSKPYSIDATNRYIYVLSANGIIRISKEGLLRSGRQ